MGVNMMNMTIGEFIGVITAGVAGFVALIKGLEYLFGKAGRAATKWLEKGLAPTNAKLDIIERKVASNQLENDKTVLVRFLADIKNGEKLTDIERERLHETYTRYTSSGGNSYIHDEWERLKNEGKL